MPFSPSFFINSTLLGVGLSMDAFSVALANGLSEPQMARRKSALIAGTFAAFQAAMPMLGWYCVRRLLGAFEALKPLIPWVSLFFLVLIGGEMIRSGLHEKGSAGENCCGVGLCALLMQGAATSIDALSVGFTIARYGLPTALCCAAIIALVTLGICLAGVAIGKRVGAGLSGRAMVLGGVLLMAVGLEIWVQGVF